MNLPVARLSRRLAGSFLGLCLVCTTTLAFGRALDPITSDEMNLRLAELQHSPWNGKFKEKDVEFDGYCYRSTLKMDVVDPQTGDTRNLKLYLYRPDVDKKVPLVMVIPTLDGITVLEPSIAVQLCDSDIAAIIADVNNPIQPPELPSWGVEDKNNRSAILSLRTILDYAETDPRFERDQIGMMGLSLGGITTAMMAGVEPDRLRAVVITVGGGNLPYVMAESDNSKVTELRRRRMSYLGLRDVSEYEERLHESIRFDPMYFASRANRDRVLMVMAERDSTVPFSVQRDLFSALKKPDYMLFSGGHIGSLVSLTYLYLDTVIDFFKARFEGKMGPIAHR